MKDPLVTVGTNAKGRGCRENRLRFLVLLGALKSGASSAKVSSALPAPRFEACGLFQVELCRCVHRVPPRAGSKGLGGAASWPSVQLTVPSMFCRASEAAGQAAQQLPAELHHAGAHRLLHHHGAVLHEGDSQQGEAQRVFAVACAPCPHLRESPGRAMGTQQSCGGCWEGLPGPRALENKRAPLFPRWAQGAEAALSAGCGHGQLREGAADLQHGGRRVLHREEVHRAGSVQLQHRLPLCHDQPLHHRAGVRLQVRKRHQVRRNLPL